MASDVARILMALLWPSLLLAGLLVAMAAAALAFRACRQEVLPPVPGEEPLLDLPSLPACRSSSPMLAVAGVDDGAGATTIAFNLAVLLATLGEVTEGGQLRRPRPVCVLADGALAKRLGVRSEALADKLVEMPYGVPPDLVNLAVRHPAGCELFAIRETDRAAEYLHLLVPHLQKHYDAVLVDCPAGERYFADVAIRSCDRLLLVTQPGADNLLSWAESTWARHLEDSTGLVVNKRVGHAKADAEERLFLHLAELPVDPRVAAFDERGWPWCLAHGAPTRQLHEIARQLFPSLMAGGEVRAA